jgi:tetratricopeptide (TPR) repeat protein
VVLLLYIAAAFKAWMIVDAVRRGVHALWYVVVMLPAGDFVYFFAVKLRDYNVHPHAPPEPNAPPSLDALRALAEESPSFHNRVRLGWALYDADQPANARECFEAALRTHAQDREARYGLGLCLLAQGKLREAAEVLGALVEQSFAHDDYRAAEALAEALHRSEQNEEACEVLAAIVRATRRIEHRIAHAKLLIRCGQRDEAAAVLAHAIAEFEAEPENARRQQGAHATEARRLLRTLSPASNASAASGAPK